MSRNGNDYGSTKRYNVNEINDNFSNKPNKPKKTKNKNPKKKKTNIIWKIIKTILITLLVLGILAALILAGIIAGLFLGLFGSDFKLTKEDLAISFSNSEVYDSDGKLVATLTGNEKRKIVSMSQMSEYIPKAYVAIEDERFYDHTGVDIKRTAAATMTYLVNKGSSSFGGSTITQQLVKNITKEDEDTATRKIKEMAKALQVEKLISKDDILELYLNIIFVGGNNVHGVALGSEYYFSKDVSKLSLAESAYMAGINNSPNMYKPFSKKAEDVELVKNRTKTVLAKMLELEFITKEQHDTAVAEVDKGLKFKQGALTSGQIYSYVTECAVEEVVEQLMEEKGMSRALAETTVYGGGLKIYTTEDTAIQKQMTKEMSKSKYVLKSRKNKKATTQAAMAMINHKTGEVVACQGKLGKKKTNGDLNRATQLLKQTGSAFKPLACVAPALQEGIITASSTYTDKKIKYGGYSPKNYYSGYRGTMTVRHAIEISCNTVQVQILNELGVAKSVEYLKQMGFTTITGDEGLSLALGGLTKGVSTLEMAAAYGCIANDGTYIEPTFYKKVVDKAGNIILKPSQTKTKVFDKEVAYIAKSILTEPVYGTNGATARYCAISGKETAAKTGTTNDDYDRWLCGFSPYYSAAVWYGYDKNETVYFSGTNPAGQIWSNVMKNTHKSLKNKKFSVPSGVVKAKVCKETGMVPVKGCPTITDYFVKGTVSKKKCNKKPAQKLTICTTSGLLAIEDVCPKTKEVTYDPDKDKIPTKQCDKHKKKEETPDKKPDKKPTNTTGGSGENTVPENTTGGSGENTVPENTTTEPTTNTTNEATGV